MKIAFMFPGQGAQKIGMCKDIYEKYDEAKEVFEMAKNILGIDVAKLCFEGPEEELNKTSNTQIAMLVSSLAIAKVLEKNGINPDYTWGLSLGEYTALILSGVLSFEAGIKLVKSRGSFMENTIVDKKVKMAAIIGIKSDVIEEVCRGVSGFVMPANYNYSMQTVISGYEESVDAVCVELEKMDKCKIVPLKTSGAFHTKLLQEASTKFKVELEKVEFNTSKVPVFKNIDGTLYNSKDNIVSILSSHIISPVRMDKIIGNALECDIDLFLEVGCGRTLSGFVKKENPNAVVFNVDSVEGILKVIEYVKEKGE